MNLIHEYSHSVVEWSQMCVRIPAQCVQLCAVFMVHAQASRMLLKLLVFPPQDGFEFFHGLLNSK